MYDPTTSMAKRHVHPRGIQPTDGLHRIPGLHAPLQEDFRDLIAGLGTIGQAIVRGAPSDELETSVGVAQQSVVAIPIANGPNTGVGRLQGPQDSGLELADPGLDHPHGRKRAVFATYEENVFLGRQVTDAWRVATAHTLLAEDQLWAETGLIAVGHVAIPPLLRIHQMADEISRQCHRERHHQTGTSGRSSHRAGFPGQSRGELPTGVLSLR